MFASLFTRDDGSEHLFVNPDMIISNRLGRTLTGANFTLQHMLHGAENESSRCLQGSPRDLIDTYSTASRLGHKFATMDMVVAPDSEMSTDTFLSVALPLIAKVFDFSPLHAIVFEHVKRREKGGSDRHWHISLPYADPLTGRVKRGSWAWSHAKCERVSRQLEVMFDPGRILLGRHQAAVITQLRAEGLHDIADAIEKARLPDATPENRTPPIAIEQAAKAANIDLREIGKAVRTAYYAADDRNEFSAALAEVGLALAVSDRDRPAWVITDPAGMFINVLSKCLPGVPRSKIHFKIGEPKDDDTGRSALQRGADAADIESDPRGNEVDAGRVGLVFSAPVGPEPTDSSSAEEGFIAALEEHDPRAVESLLSVAQGLAQGVLARVTEFFRWVLERAGAGRNTAHPSHQPPQPTNDLVTLRDTTEAAYVAMGEAATALHFSQIKISRMMDAPAPLKVGKDAHAARLAAATQEADKLTTAHEAAEKLWKQHRAKLDDMEAAHDARLVAWRDRRNANADRWLRIANRALEALKINPGLAKFGPHALFEAGMRADTERRPAYRPEDRGPSGGDYRPPSTR